MPWDPRSCGAQCDYCPLGPHGFLRGDAWRPVPPEFHAGAQVLLLGENPAEEEVANGYPFAGKSGLELNASLTSIGKKRTDICIDNVISCMPTGAASGAYKRMERSVAKENERLAEIHQEQGSIGPPPQWPLPSVCCRPRLAATVAQFRDIIALGGTATRALTGRDQGIFAMRGGPIYLPTQYEDGRAGEPRRILPTFHPAFVLRAQQWREVFQADLAKAWRWFEEKRNWLEPRYTWKPSPEELESWLAQEPFAGFVVYDLETDGIEPLLANLRCVGLGRLIQDGVYTCDRCHGTGRDATANVVAYLGPGKAETVSAWGRGVLESIAEVQGFSQPRPPLIPPCSWCKGLGNRRMDAEGVLVPLLSVDGRTRFYSELDEARIYKILKAWFVNKARWKVGHNAGSYDRQVVERVFGVIPAPLADTLFLARFRAPDLPKSLGVVGSILTDVHSWKNDAEGNKIAYAAQNDHELHYYCVLDTVVNAKIYPPLMATAQKVGALRQLPENIRPAHWPTDMPWTLFHVDHKAQDMCVGMHKLGAYIDQAERARFERELAVKAEERRVAAVAFAASIGFVGKTVAKSRGPEPFNPGSHQQLGRILFEMWGLTPKVFTETGDPSVADEVVRDIMTSEGLPADKFKFLNDCRHYNRSIKASSTFCKVLRPKHLDEDGIVWADGRARSSWNAHSTSVGRLSSSENNQQNVPNYLRSMYAAAPGHTLIGGDVDQFHLRIIANRWGIQRLQETFREGKDPHSSLAFDFFGAAFVHAKGWGPKGFSLYTADKPDKNSDADIMRQMAKVIRYRGAYWDVAEGIHQSVIKTENDAGNLIFAHMTVREVKKLYSIWMKAEPEWQAAWQGVMDQFQRNGGFLESCVLGRRSGGLDGGKKEAVVNADILPVETDIMRLIECEVLAAFPFDFEKGVGMTNQCHDSIEVEVEGRCWEEDVPQWARKSGDDGVFFRKKGKKILCWGMPEEEKRRMLETNMNIRIPGWDIPITSEAKVGRNWAEA